MLQYFNNNNNNNNVKAIWVEFIVRIDIGKVIVLQTLDNYQNKYI